MTIGLLLILQIGETRFASPAVANSVAFTSFALMLIVAAFECRSETGTVFSSSTFDSKQMNRTALLQFVLAVLATQWEALRRLLDTTELDMQESRWALAPPVALLLLWEAGKLVARRRAGSSEAGVRA